MVTAWAAQTRMALANMLAPDNNEAAGCPAAHRADPTQGLRGDGRCACIAIAPWPRRSSSVAGTMSWPSSQSAGAAVRCRGGHRAPFAQAREDRQDRHSGDHGRTERRAAVVAPVKDMAEIHDFPDLAVPHHQQARQRQDRHRYFLMSQAFSAAEVLRIVRQHWDIENCLHWSLDVVLDEDLARNRKDNARQLAVLRAPDAELALADPDRPRPCAANSSTPSRWRWRAPASSRRRCQCRCSSATSRRHSPTDRPPCARHWPGAWRRRHWRRRRRAWPGGNRPGPCRRHGRASSTMLSTAQKVQPGATERSWPDGVAFCAELVQDGAHLVVGHRVPEVGAVHDEAVERALLVDRGREELGDSPARRRPRADHVVLQRRRACRRHPAPPSPSGR